jgi:hypothetical protein
MKSKARKKEIPATIIQLAAAMTALESYSGENTEAEHEKEARRLGSSKEYYRMRLANALLGIVETEAMFSETASESTEQMLHAHQQALESAGAMGSKEKLLEFLRWRTLRIAGPLRQIAQDKETGPIPVAAAHAAEGLQQLLGISADGQHLDPGTISPTIIKANLNKARESLTYAIANLDIMLDLITKAEEMFSQPETHKTATKASIQRDKNRTERISKLLLLDLLVPLCIEKRTTEFFIPPVDPVQFQRRGNEWGVWGMSKDEFSAFEEKKIQEFTQTLTTVSPVFPLTVFALIDKLMGVAVKTEL